MQYDSVIPSGVWLHKELSKQYPIKITVCRLFYRSIHDTYIIRSNETEYFFKLYRYGFRTEEDIKRELERVTWLAKSGIKVSTPVKCSDGSYICKLDTVQGIRYGVLYTKAGIKPVNQEAETPALNRKLGRHIASVHKAWSSMPDAGGHQINIEEIVDIPMIHFRKFAKVYPMDLSFVEDIAARVRESFKNIQQNSICHGDYYTGNISLDESDEPVLFDFDFSGKGYQEYDIALYAYSFGLGCTEDGIKKRAMRLDTFLDGYSSVRSISQKEIDNIPLMIPFRRIFNLGMLYASMSVTFGDAWSLFNTNDDIDKLKKWLKLNTVI